MANTHLCSPHRCKVTGCLRPWSSLTGLPLPANRRDATLLQLEVITKSRPFPSRMDQSALLQLRDWGWQVFNWGEVWRRRRRQFFLTIENGHPPPPQVRATSGSRKDFWGGSQLSPFSGAEPGGSFGPPPPQLKAHPPLGFKPGYFGGAKPTISNFEVFLQNRLEERLLDQAWVRAPYTPPPPLGINCVAHLNG